MKVGIIGLGVGERHLVAYQEVGCEVAAICDIDPDRLADVGDRHRIRRRSTDYTDLVNDPAIEAISVCSYDDVHVEQAIAALAAGKHVMVEKPVALFRSDAEMLLRAWLGSGRILTSNLILRASPRFQHVKKMAEAGEFGDIFYMEGDYIHQILHKLTDGWRGQMEFYSVVYGGGIHLIDLMRWILGDEVVEVSAMGANRLTQDSGYRYDDTVVGLLRFAKGTLAKSLTTLGPRRTKFHALEVYGTKKTFINDLPDGKLFEGDEPEDERAMTVPYPAMEKGDLVPEFIAAIRGGREPGVSATDVFRVMDVCFALVESLHTGRVVKVEYLT